MKGWSDEFVGTGKEKDAKPLTTGEGDQVASLGFLGFGEKVGDLTRYKYWGDPSNADGLNSVGDNSFDSSPPLQILVESWVVGDFGVDLLEGNIFKMRSELFACVIRACKFGDCGGKKLLLVNHNEVEFVQWGRKVVRREANGIKDIFDRIVVWSKDEQLGAFLIAADLSSHVER